MARAVGSERFAMLRAVASTFDSDGYLRRRARAADPFTVPIPRLGDVLFTGSADGVRDILTAPATELSAPTPNPIEPLVGSGSLILLSGDRHRRERQLLMPSFHGERMRNYAGVMAKAARDEMNGWKPGDRISMREAAQEITLQIIIRTVFGVDDADRRAEYTRVITGMMSAYIAPLMFMPELRRSVGGLGPWARFVRLRTEFDDLLTEQIAQRRATGVDGYDDVLSLLLSATYEDGTSLSDDDLRQELRTLLVAGHETTATSLAWALYHIHREPQVRERLLVELGEVTELEQLSKLPYLSAVLQETLRMHPTVSVVLRRLNAPLTIRGVERKPGDVVGIAVPALHFNEDRWPDPDRFDPERFLERKATPFDYTPFGGGHRRCVGASFANYELAIVVATIMGGADLVMPDDERRKRTPRSVPRGIAALPDREIVLQVR
ncbi:cytochrome P450 [Nocardiaceae bacterium YC2-7]|uniref:Cytochrome P450 n=1 Tax=Antrihabitans stalactiti TaxID=2584121 RepID=A0A848KE05_9NOCA|nr:cytochrome P450 [Antrihabitans stalactiti]